MGKKIKDDNSIEKFNYNLPDEKIAKYPLQKRDDSKLLFYKKGTISQDFFKNISEYLPSNTLLVYNNTRVIQARLYFQKTTGAVIEIFCLEPISPSDYSLSFSSCGECVWKCMIGNKKKWKQGVLTQSFFIDKKEVTLSAEKKEDDCILFSWNDANFTFAEILDTIGELPIPPYLKRKTEDGDKKTYQTVYSKIDGSVAAPTAGLHFTDDVFHKLQQKKIERDEVTLHVGAGTFKSVKSDDISEHTMHTERILIRRSTVQNLIEHLGNITAVGTTSVRTLESLYFIGLNLFEKQNYPFFVGQWQPYELQTTLSVRESLKEILKYLDKRELDFVEAETQIMIKPGYEFRLVNAIITNFHQPKSTLLLLISAFVGADWTEIYDFALENDFRFLSYGDSSLLVR